MKTVSLIFVFLWGHGFQTLLARAAKNLINTMCHSNLRDVHCEANCLLLLLLLLYTRLSFLDDSILERKDNEIASCHRWNMFLTSAAFLGAFALTVEKNKPSADERARECRLHAISAEHIPTESTYVASVLSEFLFCRKVTSSFFSFLCLLLCML